MKSIINSIFIFFLIINVNCQMQVKSLRIINDTATLSITATSATSVDAVVWGLSDDVSDTIALVKSGGGNWSTQVKAPVGVYYYQYLVDRTPIFDRSAAGVYRGKDRWVNTFEVRNTADTFDVRKNGPFGNINICNYKSKATGNWRQCMVYTPAEYDANSSADYPVVYLLHDAGEDESAWLYQGLVNNILDNAIAQDSAQPMIIVMENTSAFAPAGSPNAGKDILDSVIVYDLVPYIDSVFHTIDSVPYRAIAGCADGGSKALDVFLKHNDTFENVGVFSTPESFDFGLVVPVAFIDKEKRLIYIGSGLSDGNYNEMLQWHTALTASSVDHVWNSYPGNYNWLVYRKEVCDMIKLLFK